MSDEYGVQMGKTVRDIMEKLGMKAECSLDSLDREVTGGYCGDLLSDVMANAKKGDMWLTIQSHQNIVAVAVLREIAAIVLVNGRTPEEETKKKAQAEGIPILSCTAPAFETAGRLYRLGIGGEDN
jgi:hypothetical protein